MSDKQLTFLEQSSKPGERITDKLELLPQDFVMHGVSEMESIEGEAHLRGGHALGFKVFSDEPPHINCINKLTSPMSYFACHRLMTTDPGYTPRVYDEAEGREVESSGRFRLDAVWIDVEGHTQDDVAERHDEAGCRLQRADREARRTVEEYQGRLFCRESGRTASGAVELGRHAWRYGAPQGINGYPVGFPNVF